MPLECFVRHSCIEKGERSFRSLGRKWGRNASESTTLLPARGLRAVQPPSAGRFAAKAVAPFVRL